MRNLITRAMRRFSAGIDIHADEIRVAVLSRRKWPGLRLCRGAPLPAIRIEHTASCALPTGAVVDAEFVDLAAMAATITDALHLSENNYPLPQAAMALPDAALLQHELSITQRQPAQVNSINTNNNNRHNRHRRTRAKDPSKLASASAATHDRAVESIVRTEAERLMRLEPAAIAIDWFYEPEDQRDRLMMVAAPRQIIDARIDLAAQANISLTVIEGEAVAALRACRFAAMKIFRDDQPDTLYGVIWMNENGSYLWLLRQHHVTYEWRFSMADLSTSPRLLIDHLQTLTRTCADADRPQRALIAGDIGFLLEALRMTIDETIHQIGTAFQCAVILFNIAHYCETYDETEPALTAQPPSPLAELAEAETYQTASLAVAFGLALQGVLK